MLVLAVQNMHTDIRRLQTYLGFSGGGVQNMHTDRAAADLPLFQWRMCPEYAHRQDGCRLTFVSVEDVSTPWANTATLASVTLLTVPSVSLLITMPLTTEEL